ncbi:VP6 [Rotavirus J]|uniref:Intermediate capsid protein VP6 n=1 Tax=Rotavirus J TaxID=1929964 RepID=A0A1L6BXL7_9REOV|nr:VP6 [Rotavirus J]APQ41757.1 VP6 [Rotavirus J]
MDLIETVNAVVSLQKRILKLSPTTQIDQNGQTTVNDYNNIASRTNGTTYQLLDPIAQRSPYEIRAPIIPLTVVLSTDDFEAMSSGIESILEALAAAIRSEGSRRNRAIVQKAQDPEVARLITTIGTRSQYSENQFANLQVIDTARMEQTLLPSSAVFRDQRIRVLNVNGVAGNTGGGYISAIGRVSGRRLTCTTMLGRPGNVVFDVRFRAPTAGTSSVTFLPAPGFIQLPRTLLAAGGIPTVAQCCDVSDDMNPDDLRIEYLLGNQIVHATRGTTTNSFPQCDGLRITVTPWDNNKNQNNNAAFNNWQNNGAQMQPTVSFMLTVEDSVSLVDYDIYSSESAPASFLMGSIFNRDSFLATPQVDWSFNALLAHTANGESHWARKIATMIAAYSVKV